MTCTFKTIKNPFLREVSKIFYICPKRETKEMMITIKQDKQMKRREKPDRLFLF